MNVQTRTDAERSLEATLALPEPVLALLYYLLGKSGWTQDRARAVLIRERWWAG